MSGGFRFEVSILENLRSHQLEPEEMEILICKTTCIIWKILLTWSDTFFLQKRIPHSPFPLCGKILKTVNVRSWRKEKIIRMWKKKNSKEAVCHSYLPILIQNIQIMWVSLMDVSSFSITKNIRGTLCWYYYPNADNLDAGLPPKNREVFPSFPHFTSAESAL